MPDTIFFDALTASFNTLKKGGKLISTTHNTDNPEVLKRVQNWWTKFEKESFISYRKNAIKEKAPEITESDLELMITATRGLLREDFNKAIHDYKVSNKINTPSKLMPAVDLTIDYICENYISPPHVIQMMKQVGFKAYCYPALMHSRRYMIFQPVARIFKSLFMKIKYFSGTVVFMGIK